MVYGRVNAVMTTRLSRFWSDEGGVSAVEFALIAAFILVPLMLGATELGYRTWAKTQFENATQAGIDYATIKGCANATTCGFNAAGVQNAVQTATALGTNVTIAPASGCGVNYYCFGCPGASGVSLSATSTNCANGGTSGTYVGLTASYSYTPLFQSCGDLLPSMLCSNSPITWTVTAVARVY
jgi:Flp pilus assembly pilin Flp